MRVLLDTHLFLWWVRADKRLTREVKDTIMSAEKVYVSSASIWEAAIKIQLKKLHANIDDLVSAIEKSGFTELKVTAKHAARVCHLKNIHKDPFDRLLVAQAMIEPLTLLTADTKLAKYTELVEVV